MNRTSRTHVRIVEGDRLPQSGSEFRREQRYRKLKRVYPNMAENVARKHASTGRAFNIARSYLEGLE